MSAEKKTKKKMFQSKMLDIFGEKDRGNSVSSGSRIMPAQQTAKINNLSVALNSRIQPPKDSLLDPSLSLSLSKFYLQNTAVYRFNHHF